MNGLMGAFVLVTSSLSSTGAAPVLAMVVINRPAASSVDLKGLIASQVHKVFSLNQIRATKLERSGIPACRRAGLPSSRGRDQTPAGTPNTKPAPPAPRDSGRQGMYALYGNH